MGKGLNPAKHAVQPRGRVALHGASMAADSPTTDHELRYIGLVRSNVEFRRVWLGDAVSFLGDWFALLALYAVVQEITDSKLALAGVLVGKTLPIFIMTPIAGPLVDRFDRRRLMLISDVARAILVGGLIVAHRLHNLPLLYGAIAAQIAFSGIFTPARTAVIPQITSARELPVAMALSGGTWSVMLAVGAALGGSATEHLGIDGAFIVDGLTYALSAAILWRLPALPPPRHEGHVEAETGFRAGVAYVRRSPWVFRLLLVKPIIAFQSAALLMIPILGNGTFSTHTGIFWVGLLFSARGFGALLGSVGTRKFTGDGVRAMRIAIPVAIASSGVFMAGVAWASSYWLALLGLFFVAIGTGTAWVFSGILLQRAADRRFHGRVFALEWGMLTMVSAMGSIVAGLMGDGLDLGEREIIAVIALYLALGGVMWAMVSWPKAPE